MFDALFASKPALHGLRIEDYAIIGDLETAALVGRSGSIDWLCWPAFSSQACFAALLGTADHGSWQLSPVDEVVRTARRYVPGTMVLETTIETAKGAICLMDFMPPRGRNSDVVRLVRGVRGRVKMHMRLALRFDYGRTVPWVTHFDGGLRAIAGPDMIVLRTKAKLEGEGMTTVSDFTVAAGEEISFTLTYGSSLKAHEDAPAEDPEPISVQTALEDTVSYWREWSGRSRYRGAYEAAVTRSLMTLKALTYRPSGGMVAAATTSLPEKIGGKRNWDYRYCWLRDTAFALLVLLQAGYEEEAMAWRRWLLRAIAGAPSQVQTVYGICGERLMTEWETDWLPGYESSQPVNIGNAASSQFQLDLFGEVASALARTPAAEDDLRVSAGSVQAQLIDHLCHVWDQPDDGIWETRGKRQHFTHSKVMAWVALDRAIRYHERFDGAGDVKRWRKNRDLIHKQVCDKGFNRRLNSFTQAYGSDALDASCLLIGIVGFLPMDDPRIAGTVTAIEKQLMRDGLLMRYDTKGSPDGLPPGEGAFLPCSFWLVTNLALLGRRQEAEALFARLLGLANDVGLLAEEYDAKAGRMLGNFPQALTHVALVHAAYTLDGLWKPEAAAD